MISSANEESKLEYSMQETPSPRKPLKSLPQTRPPRPKELLTRKSLKEYEKAVFLPEESPAKQPRSSGKKEPEMSITEIIIDFLGKTDDGATLSEITEHLQRHWGGLKHTKGYSYGKGSITRIALGALNESKAVTMYQKPESGIKMWKLKPEAFPILRTTLGNSTTKGKHSRKIPLSVLRTKITVPRSAAFRSKYKEILTLLEAIYERVGPKVPELLSQVSVSVCKHKPG